MFEYFKSMFAAKPPVEFIHPEFGVLVLEPGLLWSGKVQRDGKDIQFYVGGTAAAPNEGLLDRLRDLLGRFTEVECAALDFLRQQEPDVRMEKFTFCALDLLWEDQPDDFAMEFELAGDTDGVWRVEFQNGQPKFVGRDD